MGPFGAFLAGVSSIVAGASNAKPSDARIDGAKKANGEYESHVNSVTPPKNQTKRWCPRWPACASVVADARVRVSDRHLRLVYTGESDGRVGSSLATIALFLSGPRNFFQFGSALPCSPRADLCSPPPPGTSVPAERSGQGATGGGRHLRLQRCSGGDIGNERRDLKLHPFSAQLRPFCPSNTHEGE